jgi:hypothetical protein
MDQPSRHDVIRAALISDPVNIDRASVILGALQNAGWIVLPAEEVYGQMQRITKLEAALREIEALPDVSADERGVIARRALEG